MNRTRTKKKRERVTFLSINFEIPAVEKGTKNAARYGVERSWREMAGNIVEVAQGRNHWWVVAKRERRFLSRRSFDWTREGRRFHELPLFYGPTTTMGCPRNPHTSMRRGREISPFPRFSLIELVLGIVGDVSRALPSCRNAVATRLNRY